MGMTTGVAGALSIYAATTKTDFTMMGGMLFACSIGLLLFGIFAGIFYKTCPVLHIFFCLIAIVLYSIYLIYDIQLLVGGKTYEFTIDDYVIASVCLYIDIMLLF